MTTIVALKNVPEPFHTTSLEESATMMKKFVETYGLVGTTLLQSGVSKSKPISKEEVKWLKLFSQMR